MLKICFVFSKSEAQYAYKYYAYKKHVIKQEWERDKSVKWIWHLENMFNSTHETYNIKGHFYEQFLKKALLKFWVFQIVIDYIFIYSITYSTLIKTLQCQE